MLTLCLAVLVYLWREMTTQRMLHDGSGAKKIHAVVFLQEVKQCKMLQPSCTRSGAEHGLWLAPAQLCVGQLWPMSHEELLLAVLDEKCLLFWCVHGMVVPYVQCGSFERQKRSVQVCKSEDNSFCTVRK